MRHTSLIIAVFALSSGCAQYYDVDEACHDKVPGEKHANDKAEGDFIWRTNCYRRLMGLPRMGFDKAVQQATENHLAYMATNHSLATLPANWADENLALPSATGATIFDRLEHAGYGDVEAVGGSSGIWMWAFFDTFVGAQKVDFWMYDPGARELLLQPSMIDMGYAELPDWPNDGSAEPFLWNLSHANLIFEYPATARETKPITYPKDGQLEVPYVYRGPFDCEEERGFPITVTVGSTEAGEDFQSLGANPYALEWVNATLIGPDGAIPVDLQGPSDDDPFGSSVAFTVVATPTLPLSPKTTYTFLGTVSWNVNEVDVEMEFTTRKDDNRPQMDLTCEDLGYIDKGALGTGGGTTTGSTTTGTTTTPPVYTYYGFYTYPTGTP